MAEIKDVLVVTVNDIYGKSSSELERYLEPGQEFDGLRLPKAEDWYLSANQIQNPTICQTYCNMLSPRLIVKPSREPEVIKLREVIGAKEVKDWQYYATRGNFYKCYSNWKFDSALTDIKVYEQVYD